MYLFLPIVIEFVQVPPTDGYGFGASVIVSSLVFLPLSVGTFAASRFLGLYERRFGTRSMIPLGAADLRRVDAVLRPGARRAVGGLRWRRASPASG